MKKFKSTKVFIEVEYNDESSFSFDIYPNAESSNEYLGIVMMVTRGALMAANAVKATAYNLEGFPIASYVK